MKTQPDISRSILTVAMVTTMLLLVPLAAMKLSDAVNWSIADFVVMGALLFSIGCAYVLVAKYATTIVHKIAIGFSLGSTFLLIWANLAVGLIGGGPNPGNLMYVGVVAVGVIGTALSRFTPTGMERTMYAMAITLLLVALIALLSNMSQYPGSSVVEIIGVNAFFAALFALAGLLFHYVCLQQSSQLLKKSSNS